MNEEYLAILADRFHEPKDKALVQAIVMGDIEGVRAALRSGANPNADGDYGKSPVAAAIIARKKEALQVLLENGAKPNHRHPNGATAAVEAVACEEGDYLDALLAAGLDPSIRDGDTPLLVHAISEGKREHYRTLVEKGADLNAKFGADEPIASSLIAVGWYDELKDLIERDGDFRSAYGRNKITPAQELIDLQHRFGGDPEGAPFRKRAELLRMMRDRGVKIPDGVPGVEEHREAENT